MATVAEQIQEIYIGLLGRAADKAGLDYWTNEITTGNLTIDQVRENFVNNQPEYASGLGSMTRSQVVAELYNRLFERQPEDAGLEYWVNGDGKAVPVDVLVLALSNAAAASDRLVLDNKTDAAEFYTANITTYSADSARAAVDSVDASAASVTASKAATSAGGSSTGQTFKLTTGIDSLTGTANNDTFDATESSTGPADTLNSLDSIDGGAGEDTLNVVETSALNTTTLAGVTVKNVETANLTSTSTVTANTSSWDGLTKLNVVSADDVTVTAAATTDITIGASALSGASTVDGGKDVTVTAADTSTTGAASGNSITVGGTTAAAGKTVVTYTETISDAANAGVAGGTITATGGTSIEVNSNAVAGTGSAAADVLTIGAIGVNGNASTTEVKVTQSAATATWATAGDKIKITNGAVTVADTNATTASDTLTTVTLENFGNSSVASTVLSTLNLKGGSSAALASGNLALNQTASDTSTAATTLGLNLTSGFVGTISGTQADVYTTVNVASAADATIADIEMNELTTLNVSGAGKTTLTALTDAQNAKLTAITSTGGGLKVGTELATDVAVTGGAGVEDVMVGATTKAIDLGAGDDIVTISTTSLGAGGSVKGGEGNDTLVANTNGSAIVGLPGFTGFETLRVAGTAAQGAHNAVGFTALELGATAAAASSFVNVAAGVDLTVLAAPGGAHTVTLADATGTTDTFNLKFSSDAALNLSTNGITLNGVETINITNTDTNTTAQTNQLNLTADAATSIVVTGNAGLDMTGSTYAKVTNFDASAVSGASSDAAALAVTYVSGNTTIAENVTIKGGSGNDNLTGNAATNDTISGGAGVDTLVYTNGTDSFTGGAGNDVFDVNAVGTKTSYLTITDLTAGDTIDLVGTSSSGTIANMNAAAVNSAEVTLGASATLDQYLDAAAAGNGGTNALFTWFKFDGNTYAVVDNSAGATFVSGTDSVIKLSGSIDLSDSSITSEVLTFA